MYMSMTMNKKKILLGMSGGVDSTFSAVRLLNEGYDVEGAILVMSEHTDTSSAEINAKKLGIPLHIVDCREKFDEFVKKNFISEYCNARTPNPCTVCNRYVKMAELCRVAESIGAEKIATGHYCGIGYDEASGRYYPKKGADARKDQSYVFWNLTQKELSMLYCPLFADSKSEVKELARESGINVPEGESQDICFIPDGDHAAFIEKAVGKLPEGDFVDENGKVLGRHKGIAYYTVGQRKGLGISAGKPVFISKIDAGSNTITVSDESALFSTEFTCSSLNFAKLAPFEGTICAQVKARYAAKPTDAEVTVSGDRAYVKTAVPVRAATPGQSAVFYDGDDVLFGGFID